MRIIAASHAAARTQRHARSSTVISKEEQEQEQQEVTPRNTYKAAVFICDAAKERVNKQ